MSYMMLSILFRCVFISLFSVKSHYGIQHPHWLFQVSVLMQTIVVIGVQVNKDVCEKGCEVAVLLHELSICLWVVHEHGDVVLCHNLH